jgi:hypothetical protein
MRACFQASLHLAFSVNVFQLVSYTVSGLTVCNLAVIAMYLTDHHVKLYHATGPIISTQSAAQFYFKYFVIFRQKYKGAPSRCVHLTPCSMLRVQALEVKR